LALWFLDFISFILLFDTLPSIWHISLFLHLLFFKLSLPINMSSMIKRRSLILIIIYLYSQIYIFCCNMSQQLCTLYKQNYELHRNSSHKNRTNNLSKQKNVSLTLLFESKIQPTTINFIRWELMSQTNPWDQQTKESLIK